MPSDLGPHPEVPEVPNNPLLKAAEPIAQKIFLSNFNFEKKSFQLSTQITFVVNDTSVNELQLNIGNNCKLPGEISGFSGQVAIQGHRSIYRRLTCQKPDVPTGESKSLDNYHQCLEDEFSKRTGELLIRIPPEVKGQSTLTLEIDCLVIKPNGVNFVLMKDKDGNFLQTSHIYTYRTELRSNTYEWLPCIDHQPTLSIFEIVIEVEKGFYALATGEHTETSELGDTVKYEFRSLVPTMPQNVGFAVGVFDSYIHPAVPEVVFHCLPGSLGNMKHTIAQCDRVFEFFEELLSSRFPFPCYHMLFVYNSPDDFISYSGFSIMATDLLYHKKIIDKVHSTRKAIVNAIASQFFGCFIQPKRFNDIWLTKAIARFITFLYVERAFGFCEYIYEIYTVMKEVCDYENRFGKLCLYPMDPDVVSDNFSNPTCPVVCSPKQADMAVLKGFLVMRMLHDRLGKEPFMKVLHQLIRSANLFTAKEYPHSAWHQLLLGVDVFFQTIYNVTGREVPTLMDQWVYHGGHPHFEIHYNLNKKRNVIELEIKQEMKRGRQLYTGPLNIAVQEFDGSYTHTIQIDKELVRDDIPCHSKGRNKKRKKVLLSIGEEVEMDFSRLDADVAVLWVRIDPDLLLIREIIFDQPLICYEYMVEYERNIPAQLYALDVLKNLNTVQTIDVLNNVVMNDIWFYQVRAHAMRALANTRTKFSANVLSSKGMIEIFQEYYGCKSAPEIVASNNVVILPKSLQMYFLQQYFVFSIASQRDQTSRCPSEVVDFILNLLYFNDNSLNRFSDDYLVASYINALSRTLCLADRNPDLKDMKNGIRKIISEVVRTLNMETMKPSHGRIVQISCLNALCDLQRLGHIPVNLSFFWLFADQKCNYVETRVAAIQCIVKLIKSLNKDKWFADEMPKVIEFILKDDNPRFVYKALSKVAENPPFHYLGQSGIKAKDLPVNSQKLFDLMWNKIRDEESPRRVRLLLMDLFYVFYGSQNPEIYTENQRMSHFSNVSR